MSPKFAAIAYVLALLWLSSLRSLFSEIPAPTASPNPGSLSPDKKWEYSDGDTAKLVKAGTNDVAVEFSEACSLGALGNTRPSFGRWIQTALHFIAVVREKSISLCSTNCAMIAG